MTPITCFLFDIDGTLIDSNDAHASAWSDAFSEQGFEIEYGKIRSSIGMGGDHLLPKLASLQSSSEVGKKLEKRRGEIFLKNYLPRLKAFAGARDLLTTLTAKGYKLVVATSASEKDLKLLLDQANLEGLFNTEANSDDASRSKPSPDIILAALRKSGLNHLQAVMVGDTPYDIEAATQAGVRTIAFTCGGWSAEDLKKAGAWKVFSSPSEFLDELNHGASSLESKK